MRSIWNSWKKITETIGNFNATVIFSLLYFLLITPAGLVVRFTNDFLGTKSKPLWNKFNNNPSTIKELQLQ